MAIKIYAMQICLFLLHLIDISEGLIKCLRDNYLKLVLEIPHFYEENEVYWRVSGCFTAGLLLPDRFT